ncbi:MAG: hypothetical protein CMH55_07620 [Myxococcales bacterium]|nr:hypothetical protein [Myxococcales bacterium]|tara:strand:- start:926 stop:1228 length:303 start_codon:yes stop_codon:yes gene_type:complete
MEQAYRPRHSDEEYLREEWWEDRDVDLRQRTLRMVTTRKPHGCVGNGHGEQHELPSGSRALYESCLYDGEWVQCWLCCRCMDAWLDFINGRAAPSPQEEG